MLNLRASTTDCIEYTLISSDGKAFCSSKKIEDAQKSLELCKESKEHFVYRISNDDIEYVNNDREMLLIGVKTEPFTVNGNKIEYALTYYDIGTLADELKIDSNNGDGYSSVINTRGDYLVYEERENTTFERNNFYEIMKTADIKYGVTVEEINEKISAREPISFQCELEGEDRLMLCTSKIGLIICENYLQFLQELFWL